MDRIIQMRSQPSPEHGQPVAELKYTAYHEGQAAQYSRASEMDWDGKVDVSDDPDMDCSEDDSFMDQPIFRLKNQRAKIEVLSPEINHSDPFTSDIDIKLATKKVIPPTETKDEVGSPLDLSLGVHHKKKPQKRTMSINTEKEQVPSHTLDLVKLKATTDLIQDIKTGKANGKNICISYREDHFSDIANLEVIQNEQIPSGAFGVIVKVMDTQTRKSMIQKKVRAKELEKNEIEVPLQFPDADNIAQFFGLAWNGSELIFLMEDAGISLRQLVSSPDRTSAVSQPMQIEKIMLDVFTGISYLSKHGITHCDIKPENICVQQSTWVAKLVDFGSSRTRQDQVNYKGITPEYLDPQANKCLYEIMMQKVSNKLHILEEKDDVYATGLVGLFLIKGCHPIIMHFTGEAEYPKFRAEAMTKRKNVIKQISELDDESLQKLLDVPMSDIMKKLLPNVVALNREVRWTSKLAVEFLQVKLSQALQPPNKLSRQEPHQLHSPTADDSKFVDLSEKYPDKDLAQRSRKDYIPASPIVCQDQETDQALGVAWKGPVADPEMPNVRQRHFASTQPGSILMPAKLDVSKQHGQMRPNNSAIVQLQARLAQQEPLNLRPKCGYRLAEDPLEQQENKEYADLVESFGAMPKSVAQSSQPSPGVSQFYQPSPGVSQSYQPSSGVSQSYQPSPGVSQSYQPSPGVSQSYQPSSGVSQSYQQSPGISQYSQPSRGMAQHNLAAQIVHQFGGLPQQKYGMPPTYPVIPQKVWYPSSDTGQDQHIYHVSVQEKQQMPSGPIAIQGLSGRCFKVSENGYVGADPTVNLCGNIPNIDILMQSADEQTRPKVKGVRRNNRVSQD